ncbi:hypothetical protein GCM10009850_113110 [Nonomuraea monospora]|uniref:Uncharacterized protein n=1 Tax=Nonomuraea monospora TaxID=568818 RepID=A0ABP5PYR8_9ACTN
MVRTHLPEAPRLSPAFDDFSRKTRNALTGVPKIPYHPNYLAEITSVIQFGAARPLEAHVGVQVQGASGVLHECDVPVLTTDEAELSRSAGVAPKTKGCAPAIECKFYTSSLKLDLARSFQGLGADLGEKVRPTFVSNGSSTTIKRYLSHKKRDWEHDVIPGNTQVDGLRSKIREAFKVYLSRADPTFSI